MRGTPRAAVVVFALLASLAAPVAWAQPGGEPARARARSLLEEGARLYDQGEYQAALGKFRDAFGQFPSPKIWFNIGQTCRALGRDVEGLEAFERFLAESTDVPIESRNEARAAIAALAARVGAVVISADVDGATIAIDGRDHGLTPRAAPIRLAPGQHQVVVEKSGRLPFLRRVEVVAGQTAAVQATLADATPAPAAPPRDPAPVATTFETAAASSEAPASGLSHAGQLGAFVRGDVGVGEEVGWRLAPGLSYGVSRQIELAGAALLGAQTKGAWLGARYYLLTETWKPHLTVSVPAFFLDDGVAFGGQVGAGLTVDFNRHLGVAVDLAGALFPSVVSARGKFWLLPSVSAQARF